MNNIPLNPQKTIKQQQVIIGSILVFIIIIVSVLFDNYLVSVNTEQFLVAATQRDGEEILLSEVTPFRWDRVYTFEPYTSIEEMEDATGFSSKYFQQSTSEMQTQCYFVHGAKVVAYGYGYPDQVGFYLNLPDTVSYAVDEQKFSVSKGNGDNGYLLFQAVP